VGKSINSSKWNANSIVLIESKIARLHRSLVMRRTLFYKTIKDQNLRIMDLGCGSGPFLEYLAKAGFQHLYGIEPDSSLIKNIPSYVKAEVHVCFAEKIDFPDNFFDIIWVYCVLHHLKGIESYDAACSEIARILKPNGVVFIVEPGQWTVFRLAEIGSKLLGKVFKTFRAYSECLEEEKLEQHFFIKNRLRIKEDLVGKGFNPFVDRFFIHYWIFSARKSSLTLN
jgi:SAM-dependent methyltransferase